MIEWLDIYDPNGVPTGRVHNRALPFGADEFYLQVSVWLMDGAGNFLFTKRVHTKQYHPDCWEVTGGFAKAGETGLAAAKRELFEETGITTADYSWNLLGRRFYKNFFCGRSYIHEVYFAHTDDAAPSVTPLPEEVAGIKFVYKNDIYNFINSEKMEPFTSESYRLYKTVLM